MGAWGYYDNENDTVFDEFYDYQIDFIKKNNKQLFNAYQKTKNTYDENFANSLNEYMHKNQKKAAIHLKSYIAKLIKSNFSNYSFYNFDNRSSIITGLIIELLHVGQPRDLHTTLPKKLFVGFPQALTKLACKNIDKSFENIDNDDWKDKNKRIKALKDEYKLFNCNLKKPVTVLVKSRKGPSESATKYNVGIKKRGNDKNIWIVIETKNNIKRWKKL